MGVEWGMPAGIGARRIPAPDTLGSALAGSAALVLLPR